VIENVYNQEIQAGATNLRSLYLNYYFHSVMYKCGFPGVSALKAICTHIFIKICF